MATLLQLLKAAEQSIWKTKGKDQAKNAYRMVSTLGPGLSLDDLTTQRLSDYFQELSNKRRPATHNRYRSAMVSLLGVAAEQRLLDRLPVVPPSLDEDNSALWSGAMNGSLTCCK